MRTTRGTNINVSIAADKVRLPVSQERIQSAVAETLRSEKTPNALISIAFLPKPAMARLNKSHLGHSGATDVISFGFERVSKSEPVIGDIYICPDVAKKNAAEHGVGVREEILRLVVHGTLHVLGYDHPEDESRVKSVMWRKQEMIVARIA